MLLHASNNQTSLTLFDGDAAFAGFTSGPRRHHVPRAATLEDQLQVASDGTLGTFRTRYSKRKATYCDLFLPVRTVQEEHWFSQLRTRHTHGKTINFHTMSDDWNQRLRCEWNQPTGSDTWPKHAIHLKEYASTVSAAFQLREAQRQRVAFQGIAQRSGSHVTSAQMASQPSPALEQALKRARFQSPSHGKEGQQRQAVSARPLDLSTPVALGSLPHVPAAAAQLQQPGLQRLQLNEAQLTGSSMELPAMPFSRGTGVFGESPGFMSSMAGESTATSHQRLQRVVAPEMAGKRRGSALFPPNPLAARPPAQQQMAMASASQPLAEVHPVQAPSLNEATHIDRHAEQLQPLAASCNRQGATSFRPPPSAAHGAQQQTAMASASQPPVGGPPMQGGPCMPSNPATQVDEQGPSATPASYASVAMRPANTHLAARADPFATFRRPVQQGPGGIVGSAAQQAPAQNPTGQSQAANSLVAPQGATGYGCRSCLLHAWRQLQVKQKGYVRLEAVRYPACLPGHKGTGANGCNVKDLFNTATSHEKTAITAFSKDGNNTKIAQGLMQPASRKS